MSNKTPQPLWRKISEVIKSKIISGEYSLGQTLPSETDLGAMMGVSQGTARRALAELERAGIVTRAQGRGTVVSRNSIHTNLLKSNQNIIINTPIYSKDASIEELGILTCMTVVFQGGKNWIPIAFDRFVENPPSEIEIESSNDETIFQFILGDNEDSNLHDYIIHAFDERQACIYYGSLEILTKNIIEGGANGIKVWARMGDKTYRVGLARLSGCVFIIIFSATSAYSAGQNIAGIADYVSKIGGYVIEAIVEKKQNIE